MLNLPETVHVEYQPNFSGTLTDLVEGSYNGHPTVTGRVVEGVEINRLFQSVSRRDAVGQRRTAYGVTQAELDKGSLIRVNM